MESLPEIIEFNWDGGNMVKNHERHDVLPIECEEVFSNEPLLVFDDLKHSVHETRYLALGITSNSRRLSISFTIRRKSIRIISARNMSNKERKSYEKTKKNSQL